MDTYKIDYNRIKELCEIFKPDECSIEITFVNKIIDFDILNQNSHRMATLPL